MIEPVEQLYERMRRQIMLLRIAGVVFGIASVPLLIGGAYLASLGGSFYYLICGAFLAAIGVELCRQKPGTLILFAVLAVGTLAWAFWEVGLDFWQLVPRLTPLMVIGLVLGLLTPLLKHSWRRTGLSVAGASLVLGLLTIGAMFFPHGVISPDDAAPRRTVDGSSPSRWQFFGRDGSGSRFGPESQITRENVSTLKTAWTYRTGDAGTPGSEYQVTPTQIGDTLYLCTPLNRVIALDADTGEERWSFDPKVPNNQIWNRCRGVGYFESTSVAAGDACHARVVVTTLDGRLIQVDARDGNVCPAFGTDGVVDLKKQMGDIPPTFYQPTSMPTVAGGLIIVGGWVFDNIGVDMPSGVVRAFDAENGALVWAWDVGRPKDQLPTSGEVFTRSTPNMWSTPAVDESLGLVYLPTGNQTPDYWGADRLDGSERVSSSIVALDLKTGQERWVFQTVHHDIWDLDVAPQPALYDIPQGGGATVPVIVQATKRGQIFVLDRRDGKPVFPVEELPVPQRHQKPDRVSPTQPYSTGVAAIGAEPLTERRMWGVTLFDQMLCRIMFKRMRYDGDFTAPSTEPTLFFPGNFGGMNWGGVSIDGGNDMLIVNDIRMPQGLKLIEQREGKVEPSAKHGTGLQPQLGAPYAAEGLDVNSPLGIPCIAPPWGTLSGVDMKTGKLVWQRPAGTVKDVKLGPIKVGLPIPLGLPTLGGPLTTGSGLAFYAGTQDYYLRAMDSATGEELWKGRMPVGAQAAPMTYTSPKTSRQYVVIVAGGARQSPDRGDYVIAYSLPLSRGAE
ncbi:membrane-bound PQQ-dependent dehydrogenase, glucose/quinate/shikimate family [Xanthomonas melonis]|nr:membrane-bound PQQ-dependent dehydrogenase, glucose/quinate/shikimate family [Xanthomonas melonis]MCC4602258.1 membrane-bound PQQ-dependent dehydrogenase, glucose/quinate/shikimate family [Xanthomonas melonis]